MTLDFAALAVLGDAREERGQGRAPLWLVEARADADIYADIYANADANAYANAYAYADADADADIYANADANANANTDAADDADAADAADANEPRNRRPTMRNGIYAVTLAQSGRTVLRVGWFRRDSSDPDEYEVTWCTPYRGEYTTQLADVWTKGPSAAPAWQWGKPVPSVAHRIHFQPLARLDPKHWESICPRPEGWE